MGIAVPALEMAQYQEAIKVYEGLRGQYEVLSREMGKEAADQAVQSAADSVARAKAKMRVAKT